jgi:hypothetical protein
MPDLNKVTEDSIIHDHDALPTPPESLANDHDVQLDYVSTYVNYWKESPSPPPDQTSLSTHDIRITRRKEDSPNCSRTSVRIKNIRGHSSDFTLHRQGFQICHLNSSLADWNDPVALKDIYFQEISTLLKRVTGATYVLSYEHHIRRKSLKEALSTQSDDDDVDIDGPVRRVHIDETPRSARTEFNYYIPRNASAFNASLHERPFGIYNVWKPLRTIRRDPLAVCDARSLRDEDLRPGAVTVPNVGEIENYAIRPPAEEGRHRWHFLKGQTEEEALVFRIFDSRWDGGDGRERWHGVAHTSFVDPGTENIREDRESVEVRSFCVF